MRWSTVTKATTMVIALAALLPIAALAAASPDMSQDSVLTEAADEFDIDKPVSEWTADDIDAFVNAIYAQDTLNSRVGKEITVSDLERILSEFNAKQFAAFQASISALAKRVDAEDSAVSQPPQAAPRSEGSIPLGGYWT